MELEKEILLKKKFNKWVGLDFVSDSEQNQNENFLEPEIRKKLKVSFLELKSTKTFKVSFLGKKR